MSYVPSEIDGKTFECSFSAFLLVTSRAKAVNTSRANCNSCTRDQDSKETPSLTEGGRLQSPFHLNGCQCWKGIGRSSDLALGARSCKLKK